MLDNKKNKTSLELTQVLNQPYKYGFQTNVKSEVFPRGINKEIIELLSAKKNDSTTYFKWELFSYSRDLYF
jgi:Fe-S cluster assembly protein SufB